MGSVNRGKKPSENGKSRLKMDGMLRMVRWCRSQWQVLHGTLKTSSVAVSEKDATFCLYGRSDPWDLYCQERGRATVRGGGEQWGVTSLLSLLGTHTSPSEPLNSQWGYSRAGWLAPFYSGGDANFKMPFSPNWSTNSMQDKSFSPKNIYPIKRSYIFIYLLMSFTQSHYHPTVTTMQSILVI